MKTKTLANQNERLARVILTEMEIAFKYFQTGLNSKEEYINRMIPLTQMSKVLEKVLWNKIKKPTAYIAMEGQDMDLELSQCDMTQSAVHLNVQMKFLNIYL